MFLSAVSWEKLVSNLDISQDGKLSVYIDNSSSDKVYFDEFIIERTEATVAVVVQENHYYPFGMNMKGIEELDIQSIDGNDEHRFQYNGKEKEESFGLYWNDHGARNLDVQLGRWNGVDPLAEKYQPISSYAYVANNPLKFTDPDGMRIVDNDGIIKNYKEHLSQTMKELKDLVNAGNTNEFIGKLIDFQKNQLKEIKNLENSDQVYNVFYSEDGADGGGTYYDSKTDNVSISLKKSSIDSKNPVAVIAHELVHATQYDNGEISFVVDNSGYGTLYDIGDETASYNTQFVLEYGAAFFMSSSYTFSDENTRRFGANMTPPAYSNLPSDRRDIKSDVGKELRKQIVEAGKKGLPVKEVYIGWKKDYEKGKKQSK